MCTALMEGRLYEALNDPNFQYLKCCVIPSPEYEPSSDLLLINITWQRRQDVTSTNNLYKIVTPVLISDPIAFLTYMLWCNKLPWWRGQLGNELRVASNQQLTRKWGPHFKSQGSKFFQKLHEVVSTSFSGWAFTWDWTLANNCSLWESPWKKRPS